MKEDIRQKHYLIYQTTNLVNGKIYIGKHETFNIEDGYFGSGDYLRKAINKHGIENFEFKILIDLKSREEMNLLEKLVVTEEFCARPDTYNIKVGGEGGWDYVNKTSGMLGNVGWRRNKTDLENHAICLKGGLAFKAKLENMPIEDYQQYCSGLSARKQTWDKNHPGYFAGEKNPMYGHCYMTETRKKLSISQSGSRNSQYGKMWICNDATHESRSISKTDPIPEGWRKGRFCK